jgi:uncharacterized caspase-like protein
MVEREAVDGRRRLDIRQIIECGRYGRRSTQSRKRRLIKGELRRKYRKATKKTRKTTPLLSLGILVVLVVLEPPLVSRSAQRSSPREYQQ